MKNRNQIFSVLAALMLTAQTACIGNSFSNNRFGSYGNRTFPGYSDGLFDSDDQQGALDPDTDGPPEGQNGIPVIKEEIQGLGYDEHTIEVRVRRVLKVQFEPR